MNILIIDVQNHFLTYKDESSHYVVDNIINFLEETKEKNITIIADEIFLESYLDDDLYEIKRELMEEIEENEVIYDDLNNFLDNNSELIRLNIPYKLIKFLEENSIQPEIKTKYYAYMGEFKDDLPGLAPFVFEVIKILEENNFNNDEESIATFLEENSENNNGKYIQNIFNYIKEEYSLDYDKFIYYVESMQEPLENLNERYSHLNGNTIVMGGDGSACLAEELLTVGYFNQNIDIELKTELIYGNPQPSIKNNEEIKKGRDKLKEIYHNLETNKKSIEIEF